MHLRSISECAESATTSVGESYETLATVRPRRRRHPRAHVRPRRHERTDLPVQRRLCRPIPAPNCPHLARTGPITTSCNRKQPAHCPSSNQRSNEYFAAVYLNPPPRTSLSNLREVCQSLRIFREACCIQAICSSRLLEAHAESDRTLLQRTRVFGELRDSSCRYSATRGRETVTQSH